MWSIDFTPSVQNTCGAIFLLSTRIGFTWLISSFFPYKTSPRWASAANWSLFSLAEAVYKSQYCPPSIVFPSSAIFVQKKKRKKCWGESEIKKEQEEKCLTETVDGIQSPAGAGWDLVEACSYINYPADTWWLNSSDSDSLRMLNWSVCLKVQDNRRNGEEKYRPGTCNSWIKELPDFLKLPLFFFSLNFSAKLPGKVKRFHQVVNDIKELPVASETEIVDIFVMIGPTWMMKWPTARIGHESGIQSRLWHKNGNPGGGSQSNLTSAERPAARNGSQSNHFSLWRDCISVWSADYYSGRNWDDVERVVVWRCVSIDGRPIRLSYLLWAALDQSNGWSLIQTIRPRRCKSMIINMPRWSLIWLWPAARWLVVSALPMRILALHD